MQANYLIRVVIPNLVGKDYHI